MFASASKWLQLGSVAVGSILSFTPQEIVAPDFRAATRPIVVEINRASPAFAALEDIRYNYGFEDRSAFYRMPQVLPTDLEKLGSGETYDEHMVASQLGETRELKGLVVEFAEETPAPTLQEAAQALVQEELRRRAEETPDKKIIPSRFGNNIVVARVVEPVSATPKRNLFMPSREIIWPDKENKPTRRIPNQAKLEKKENRTPSLEGPQTDTGFVATQPNPVGFMNHRPSEETSGEQLLTGQVRFVGGIAYAPGSDTLDIYQEVDGAAVSVGAFHFQKGYFHLKVEELKGRVIGEIRNRDGEKLGRGEILLADVPKSETRNLTLRIAPLFDGLSGQVLAGASSFKSLPPVEEARLFVEGMNREIVYENQSKSFIDKELRPRSLVQLRAEAPGYWGGLFFAEAGTPFEARIFSHKIVNALLDLASPNKFVSRENSEKSIIWGRIMLNGRPLARAIVELPFTPDLKPTYFTGFLPDRARTETSESGEFVFVGVPAGLHIVRARLNDKTFAPILIETADRHVAIADYEIQQPRSIQHSSYVAFTDEARPAYMQILGEDRALEISESAENVYELQLTKGLTLAEFEGGEEFRLTRLMLNGRESEIRAPLFKKEWADAFGERLVVGQIEGEDFQVILDARAPHADVHVVYLDVNGQPTGLNYGEAGAGFVISGLPHGLHTIAIVPAKSKKVLTQVVYVDDHAIHYLKKGIY